jgi:hypothetical protein
MVPLLVATLLGLSGILIVIYPLLGLEQGRETVTAAEPLSEAAERERLAKRALRDVDFDYRLGNLDEADYVALRDRYEERALAALKTRYEREQALDALIDEQVAALRGRQRPAAARTASKAGTGAATGAVNGASATKARATGPAPAVRRSAARRKKGV